MTAPIISGLPAGTKVRLHGSRGTYVIRSIHEGTLTLWGGIPGKERWRQVRPERVSRVLGR